MRPARLDPRAQHRIERNLSRSDPWLAAEFAMFNRFTQGVEMPAAEQFRSGRRGSLAMLLLPIEVIARLGAALAARARKRLTGL
ncbi:MAG: hypothetical protein ACM3ML_01665 [Micromonosporaceae bacterium]